MHTLVSCTRRAVDPSAAPRVEYSVPRYQNDVANQLDTYARAGPIRLNAAPSLEVNTNNYTTGFDLANPLPTLSSTAVETVNESDGYPAHGPNGVDSEAEANRLKTEARELEQLARRKREAARNIRPAGKQTGGQVNHDIWTTSPDRLYKSPLVIWDPTMRDFNPPPAIEIPARSYLEQNHSKEDTAAVVGQLPEAQKECMALLKFLLLKDDGSSPELMDCYIKFGLTVWTMAFMKWRNQSDRVRQDVTGVLVTEPPEEAYVPLIDVEPGLD